MRLRWAKSKSTFFRRFCAVILNSDAVHWRAKSLTISYYSRDTECEPLFWGVSRGIGIGAPFMFHLFAVRADVAVAPIVPREVGSGERAIRALAFVLSRAFSMHSNQ